MAEAGKVNLLPKDLRPIEGYTAAREALCDIDPQSKGFVNECDRHLAEALYREWQDLNAKQQKRFQLALSWLTRTTVHQCVKYADQKADIVSNSKVWTKHFLGCKTAVITDNLREINEELESFDQKPISIEMPEDDPEYKKYTWSQFLREESRPPCPAKEINTRKLLPRCVPKPSPKKP